MRRRLTLLFGLAATLAVYLPAASQADAKTYYWISHGSPADPVWTYFLQGAEQWAATSPLWNEVLTVLPVSFAHCSAPARK